MISPGSPSLGEVLAHEFMAPAHTSPESLAAAIGVSVETMLLVISGAYTSDDLISRLARHYGTSTGFWAELRRARTASTRPAPPRIHKLIAVTH